MRKDAGVRENVYKMAKSIKSVLKGIKKIGTQRGAE
jgi:hypothetical protein